jgi:hypothetical protein
MSGTRSCWSRCGAVNCKCKHFTSSSSPKLAAGRCVCAHQTALSASGSNSKAHHSLACLHSDMIAVGPASRCCYFARTQSHVDLHLLSAPSAGAANRAAAGAANSVRAAGAAGSRGRRSRAAGNCTAGSSSAAAGGCCTGCRAQQ